MTFSALYGRFSFSCPLILIMSRNRAERRSNTSNKANRRADLSKHTHMCSGKVSKNGEARTCPLCEAGKHINRDYFGRFLAKKLSSWIAVHN